jgi:threonine synthase
VTVVATRLATRLVCAGCGALAAREPFGCPAAEPEDDVDHVLRRELDRAAVEFPGGDAEPNPFVRYRSLLHAYHVARANDVPDAAFVELVRVLDERVAAVDGHGFAVTPCARNDALSRALGFSARGGVWIKDETDNVSGSHKARHLFGVLVFLEVAELVGWAERGRELAVASCGNAALAAGVVAAAGARALRVFVPPAADPIVLARLEELEAKVTVCPREAGVHGDPTVRAMRAALDEGAVPFTCQGNLNGLAIEGGHTLGWELAATGVAFDRLVVQVGGGALASACAAGLREAGCTPRLDTVQTEGAWPLRRAYERVLAAGGRPALRYAARHRSQFMWPWGHEPRSIAHGILDDETYDWLAVVEAMLRTGGRPLVVGEELLARVNELAVETTGIAVDPTGSAGLAGLLALRAEGAVGDDERVAVLFTGVRREGGKTT